MTGIWKIKLVHKVGIATSIPWLVDRYGYIEGTDNDMFSTMNVDMEGIEVPDVIAKVYPRMRTGDRLIIDCILEE